MTTQEVLQGVHDWTNGKIVYDISAAHPDGQGNPTKYADLTAALGTGGANIPETLRKGGMSVKFVLTSDNKYVQARCMAQSFTTDVTQWQGVDDEPTAGSDNMVKSGGVYPIKSFVFGGNDFGAQHQMMINSSGLWIIGSGSNIPTHYVIPVTNGDSIHIKGDTTTKPQYAVLASYAPVQSQSCDFADGWTEVDDAAESTFTVPSDGEYLYILCLDSSGNDHTPTELEINGVNLVHESIDERFNEINNSIGGINENLESVDSSIETLDYTVNGGERELTPIQLTISSTGTASTTSGTAIFIPVQAGDVVNIVSNSSKKAQYSLLQSYSENPKGVVYATGYSGYIEVSVNSSSGNITVGEDANYLYIRNEDKYAASYLPSKVYINGSDYLGRESYDKKIKDLNDEVFGCHRTPDIVTGSINSSGLLSNINGTCWFIPFTEGNTAVITSNNTKKAQYVLVNAYNMQSKTITYATGYSVPIEIPVNQSSALITAPSDCNYLYILNTDKYDTSYFPSKIVINGEDYLDKPSLNAKIIAVDSKIDALEESMKAPTFSAFGEQEQQLVNKVLSDKDTNTITFGVITDTHNTIAYDNHRTAKQAFYIGKLSELVSAQFIVNLGDVIHGQNDTHQANMNDLIEYWKQGHRTFIPTFYTIAHHEQYGAGVFQNYPISLSPEECEGVYGLMNRNIDVTWNSDKTCWYFDENDIRFIGLNSSSQGALGFSNEVIAFLQSALNSCTTPVVCMSHVACNTNVSYGSAANEAQIESALANYSNGVIAYFHGHTHWDSIWKLSSAPFLYWCTCCSEAVKRPFNYTHAPLRGVPENYNRTVGDYSEFCFDIVNIHKDTGVIRTFRFGAGYDRVAHNNLSVAAGNTLTLVPTIGGTIEWDIYDSTSGYVKDAQEQTATLHITRDVATINNGVVSALSAGISIAVASNGTAKEFFYITVS